MRSIDQVFAGLRTSKFRSRFHLARRDRAYLATRGMAVVQTHARDFILTRLAPAAPANDGKQTPFRGHPVFVAQHATATCCRSCLETWHGIAKGRALDAAEIEHVLAVIARWLEEERVRAGGESGGRN